MILSFTGLLVGISYVVSRHFKFRLVTIVIYLNNNVYRIRFAKFFSEKSIHYRSTQNEADLVF